MHIITIKYVVLAMVRKRLQVYNIDKLKQTEKENKSDSTAKNSGSSACGKGKEESKAGRTIRDYD